LIGEAGTNGAKPERISSNFQ